MGNSASRDAVHDLDLIRAAAEDVAAARLLLKQRQDTLEAISKTARERGMPPSEIAAATAPFAPVSGHRVGAKHAEHDNRQ